MWNKVVTSLQVYVRRSIVVGGKTAGESLRRPSCSDNKTEIKRAAPSVMAKGQEYLE